MRRRGSNDLPPGAAPATVARPEPGPATPPSPRGRLGRSSWLPAGAWIAAATTVAATCEATGRFPFHTSPWLHWDAFRYLDLSHRGYELSPCFLPNGLLGWCGNAGWFPGYPWLIRGLASVGLGHAEVAIALSWLFDLAAVVLLWAAFYGRLDVRAAAAVLFAAFAPGLVYDYAAFPLSMLAFFTVLFFALLDRERWLAAGLAGFVLMLTYPVGVAVPVAAATGLLTAYRSVPLRSRARRVALTVTPSLGALALLGVVQQRSTGHWDAYLLFQDDYRHNLQSPFARTAHAVRLLFDSKLFTLGNAPYAQTLLVTATVACILVAMVVRRSTVTPFEVTLVLWMLTAWAIPQATTGTSSYRGEAALLPAAILVGALPRVLAAAIVAAAVAVSIPMEVLFLRNTLV